MTCQTWKKHNFSYNKLFLNAMFPTLLHFPVFQLKSSHPGEVVLSAQLKNTFFILAGLYPNEWLRFLEAVAASVTTTDEYGKPFHTCSLGTNKVVG